MQFSGYLLLNDNLDRMKSAASPMQDLRALTDRQWKLLSEGDALIRLVNASVITALSEELGPILADVCDPYHSLKTGKRHPSISSAAADFVQYSDAMSRLVNVYRGHPSVPIVKAIAQKLPPIAAEGLTSLTLHVRSVMEQEPGRPTEGDIDDLRGQSKSADTPTNLVMAMAAHLYAVWKSLTIVDSLVFDAFVLERLVVLSEDNCFSVSHGRDFIGMAAQIELQPTDRELERNAGDLVFLDLPKDDYSGVTGLALIETERIGYADETGMTINMSLRPLDEWLNPYPKACNNDVTQLLRLLD
jgi:hypothetical protein